MSRRQRDETEFSSYYDRPIVKEPTWAALDIAGYFFLGGLAGASSVVAAGAQATGRPALARRAKLGALAAITASTAALIHDLGRPARFLNMLRVFKPTSPMSVGVWIVGAYATATGAAAAADVAGSRADGTAFARRLRPVGIAATASAATLGPAVAAYTAVLISNTAIPAWHEVRRELPFVFVSSAACAASGLALIVAPDAEAGPARRLAAGAAASEIALVELMERRAGIAGEPYSMGEAGRLMKVARALTAGGALAGLVPGRRVRAVGGLALLAGSACTRFGVFAAGQASARDPRYTVVPQRARRDAADAAAAAASSG